ncbi:hypothetical protein KPH14_007005 [Odynerus spinipes]|uniref:Carbohydrate sulfotransferase n=1 Tax=Odynerus spinipes TaxID=1348599 RepID=A0AAD9VS08_9HYME|nr:hypothetical protein KPH14_007005 [Odynerus spinipes]
MFNYQDNRNIWPKCTKSRCFYVTNTLTLMQKKIILQLIIICVILFTLLITLERSWYNMDKITEKNTTVEVNNISRIQSAPQYMQTFEEVPIINSNIILSTTDMINKRLELNARRQKIENICTNYSDKELQLYSHYPNIIIDTKHGISWCPIYKVGSSVWMKNFATLAGILTDRIMNLVHQNVIQINSIVRQAFPPDLNFNNTLKKLDNTKKFLIVRHPFERLLSAYRDKLEHIEGREYYYKRFGRHITYRYRRNKKLNETKLEPTFQEFLEYIANERYFDEHWAPYYDTCKPCTIHYDYILKFETFQEDYHFFIQETGLRYYLYRKYDLKNMNQYGPTTSTLLKKYLETIPKLLLRRIYKIYEKDFQLFSYSPDLY